MLIDKHATLQCLGCIMKKPSLLEEYTLTQYDFCLLYTSDAADD